MGKNKFHRFWHPWKKFPSVPLEKILPTPMSTTTQWKTYQAAVRQPQEHVEVSH